MPSNHGARVTCGHCRAYTFWLTPGYKGQQIDCSCGNVITATRSISGNIRITQAREDSRRCPRCDEPLHPSNRLLTQYEEVKCEKCEAADRYVPVAEMEERRAIAKAEPRQVAIACTCGLMKWASAVPVHPDPFKCRHCGTQTYCGPDGTVLRLTDKAHKELWVSDLYVPEVTKKYMAEQVQTEINNLITKAVVGKASFAGQDLGVVDSHQPLKIAEPKPEPSKLIKTEFTATAYFTVPPPAKWVPRILLGEPLTETCCRCGRITYCNWEQLVCYDCFKPPPSEAPEVPLSDRYPEELRRHYGWKA